jgi:TonB C terminal
LAILNLTDLNLTSTWAVAALFLFTSAFASAGDVFECTDPVGRFDDDQPVVVVATVNNDGETGQIDVAGVTYATDYTVIGFDRRWGSGGNDEIYEFLLLIKPNGDATYMNFGDDPDDYSMPDIQRFFCRFTTETRYQTSNTEAAADSGEMARYQFALLQKIMRNWVQPASALPGIECVIDVRQSRTGDVITATVGHCNGDAAVRRSIEEAVLQASPLPQPEDPNLFQRDLRITFKPEE